MAGPRPNAGRKPKYTQAEEMQKKVDEYFGLCEVKEKPPTMSGLAMALDMSRQCLCDYSNKDEFFDTIKKARQRVEVHLEERLDGNGCAGTIFNLKNNFGWKDKTETEHTGSIEVKAVEYRIIDPKT